MATITGYPLLFIFSYAYYAEDANLVFKSINKRWKRKIDEGFGLFKTRRESNENIFICIKNSKSQGVYEFHTIVYNYIFHGIVG